MIGSEGSQGAPTRRRQDLLTSRKTGLLSGAGGKHTGDADRPSAPMVPPLAHAFLALADDDSLPEQRTLPRVVVAVIAAWALAIGLPLALSTQHPPAVLSAKTAIVDE
jgi:hypothetical protein